MKFHPNYPNDNNKGQRQIWEAIKQTFARDEGVAYYRYPIFATTGRGRSEPDFLMVHRKYGIWVLESKGCLIGNIVEINGHDWQMRGWYQESMSPISQVEAQFYEVKTLVERDPTLRRLRIPMEYRVVLPFITKTEWSNSGFRGHPSTDGVVLFDDDIHAGCLRNHFAHTSGTHMPEISDAEWERLLGAFRGTASDEAPREAKPDSPPASPSRIIHAVESRLRVLDEHQSRVAQEVPEGPQRLRGLAGSGKTILLAKRVAQMHAAHPDWDIAFVYWSRSLREQVRWHIEKAYKRLTSETPNWDRLRVLHAWGGKDLTGFYRETAIHWGLQPLSLGQAENLAQSNEDAFAAACRVLEDQSGQKQSLFDAILIDEGQDLPASFYRLAYHALRPPKRLYWAYDEAQGIDSLIVPSAKDVFGVTADGKARVDIAGTYPSGIQKAHNMSRCYRTPRLILTAAHAINMGLLREGGALQGVSDKEQWGNLGYEVLDGDFSMTSVKERKPVTIQRTIKGNGHPVDLSDFSPAFNSHATFELHLTKNKSDEIDIVVHGVQDDLQSGFRPDDIAIVSLGPLMSLSLIEDRLKTLGIQTHTLNTKNKDSFKKQGCVTLSGIRRAKGNEAYKVYVLNLGIIDSAKSEMDELILRNQAFVALTRTKLWCVVAGEDSPVMQELVAAKKGNGQLTFVAYNKASLQRIVDDSEYQNEQIDLFADEYPVASEAANERVPD